MIRSNEAVVLTALLLLLTCLRSTTAEAPVSNSYYAVVMTCLDGTRMTPLFNNQPAQQCHGYADDATFQAFTDAQVEKCAAQAPPGVTGPARYSSKYVHFDAYPFLDSASCVTFQTAIASPPAQSSALRHLLEVQNDAQAAHCGCKDMIDFMFQEAIAQIPWGAQTSGSFCDSVVDWAETKLGTRYCKQNWAKAFMFAGTFCGLLVNPITGALGDAFQPVCEAGVALMKSEIGLDLDAANTKLEQSNQAIIDLLTPQLEKVCGPMVCSDGSPASGCSVVRTGAATSVASLLSLGSTAYCGFASLSSSNSSGSSDSSPSGGCFPGKALATTPKGPIVMSKLKIGDQVLAASNTGKLAFESIFTFTDSNRDVQGAVVNLVVQAENSIKTMQLTPKHYVIAKHTASDYIPTFSASSVISAAELQVGDIVWTVLDNQSLHVSPAHIISITAGLEKGWYAPQVPSGTIVVNGVIAATYTTALQNRQMWQVAMAVLRIWQPMQHFVAQVQSQLALVFNLLHGRSI